MKPSISVAITPLLFAALLPLAACTSTSTQTSAAEYADDAATTARVKLALLNTEGVQASAVNVETYRGVVQLSGFVDSPEMAQRAVSAVSRVVGVRNVKNDMRIKPSKQP